MPGLPMQLTIPILVAIENILDHQSLALCRCLPNLPFVEYATVQCTTEDEKWASEHL